VRMRARPRFNEQHLRASLQRDWRSSRRPRTSSALMLSAWTTPRALNPYCPCPIGRRCGIHRATAAAARSATGRRSRVPSNVPGVECMLQRAVEEVDPRKSIEEVADAVFGSRFAGGEARRARLFRHELGNRIRGFLTNLVTDVTLTDIGDLRQGGPRRAPARSRSSRTASASSPSSPSSSRTRGAALRGPDIVLGPHLAGRKKIGWTDDLKSILRFWFFEEFYVAGAHGSQILAASPAHPA
jgi:hypothetical protein